MPRYEPTHVSKQKAISMLAPAIDAMRAKGYRRNNIAAWLSEWRSGELGRPSNVSASHPCIYASVARMLPCRTPDRPRAVTLSAK